jgi:hypothetical protein
MITTQEYFNMSVDKLLQKDDYEYTKEERMLFDSGSEVVFFDSEEELALEQAEFNNYIKGNEYEIKATLETINQRIAVVLI